MNIIKRLPGIRKQLLSKVFEFPEFQADGLDCRLLRMIASRVRDEVDSSTTRNSASELGYSNINLKTVAILPVSRTVPIDVFARKLQVALEGIGASTSFLNQASISSHLGRHAFTRMGKLKVKILFMFSIVPI